METVLKYALPGLMTLSVSGNVAGRLSRYIDRIGINPEDIRSLVNYTFEVSGGVGESGQRLKLWDEQEKKLKEISFSGTFAALPVFFETRYFFRADFPEVVKSVRVVHPMAAVTDCFNFSDGTLVGTLDFVNTPGKFQLKLELFTTGGVRFVSVEFMVVSVKMDVANDYGKILEKIEKEQKNLVYAFLSKTLGGAGYDFSEKNTEDVVWYAVLQKVFEYYKDACGRVIHRPHLKYTAKIYPRRAERIRKWSPAMVNKFGNLSEERRRREYFKTEQIEPEPDSVENRFVLFTLKELAHRLEVFSARLRESDTVSKEYVMRLDEQHDCLLKMVRAPFFGRVGRFSGFSQQSLVLQKRQGYAQIYEAWIKLKAALDPTGCEVDIGYRPISALYEFWCFLVIRDYLIEKYGNVQETAGDISGFSDLFDDEFEGASTASLCKFDCVFTDVQCHRKITLSYQKTYGTQVEENFAYLNAQRPDIVLTIREGDLGENVFTYLFDAKYRIASFDGKDASPREAIDDMHRYRDAILYRSGDKLSREIVGAYVLFPGRPLPDSFDYGETIRRENIGAIPLLPSEDGRRSLNNFLERILNVRGTKQHLDAAIPPRGASIIIDSAEAVREITMYGTTRGKEQLEWMRGNGFYALPLEAAILQGINDESDASQKKWLVLVPPPRGSEQRTRVCRILDCAGCVEGTQLRNEFRYFHSPTHERYWVWSIDAGDI